MQTWWKAQCFPQRTCALLNRHWLSRRCRQIHVAIPCADALKGNRGNIGVGSSGSERQRGIALTVIFHTNAGAPVLAGDMLLSVPGPNAYTDLRLPSHPNGITIPADVIPGHLPILMRRKVFVVNEHLAVGAAGSAIHVQTFLSDLTQGFRGRSTFTRSELIGFLDQYGSSEDGQETLEQIGVLILARATDWNGSLTKGCSIRET